MPSPVTSNPDGAAAAPARIPTAGPPPRAWYRPLLDPVEPIRIFTRENIQGAAASLFLHGLLLLGLALWYFSPMVRSQLVIDSRLAGSLNGTDDGDMLRGGLNTPLEIPPAALLEATADAAPNLIPIEMPPLDLEVKRPAATRRPSAGGGMENNNPGAGDGDGFGKAMFGQGGEVVRGVRVKVGDPQFTLIWDAEGPDLDLHVIEPGGKEIYWESPKGEQGGELDVDNQKGFGPENIYWMVESKEPGGDRVLGQGPPGVYKWWVVYWGGFAGIPKPTQWKVRVKHNGKVSVYRGKFQSFNQRSRTYTLVVEDPSAEPVATPEK